MKKLQKFNCEIAFSGGEYKSTSALSHFRYTEPQEKKVTIIADWELFFNKTAKRQHSELLY